MTTEDLISYIKKQVAIGASRESITSKLVLVGWRREDIDEGFSVVEKANYPKDNVVETPVVPMQNKSEKLVESPSVDSYRESVFGNSNFSEPIEPNKIENIKGETKQQDVFSQVGIEIEGGVSSDEELIPNLLPKTKKEEFIISPTAEIKIPERYQDVNPTAQEIKPVENKIEEVPQQLPTANELIKEENTNGVKEEAKVYQIKDLPKIAMISSYNRDIESMQSVDGVRVPREEKKAIPFIPQKKRSKRWIIFVVIIAILLGVSFIFANNYFNIRNLGFSLIKKDPRVLLLNNSNTLSSLLSYKTETNVEISMPSFANISAGLVSGEAVSSLDKDTLSLNTIGRINKTSGGLMSDNFVTIKSSVLDNYITTDIKNNGTSIFISIPDLSQIVGESTSESIVVRANEDQAPLVSSIMPDSVKNRFTKINLYRILSQSISSFLDNETLDLYNQFINDAVITEKGEESIKGINTYHYIVNTDKQLSKKLLTKIFENLTYDLSDEDEANLSEITGATSISSFEVWVGKNDNNIYQYKVVLSVPLSKVLNFEDKSIGDNVINVDWTTTYYDFGVMNNIFMPEQFVTIDKFTKIMSDIQMKNDTSSFKQYATNMKNAEGSYGYKANGNGSCMNPTSGSLFSPTGHAKSALESVSSISLLLNKILEKTYGAGTCYSTPSAWSFAVPIADDYDPFSQTGGEYRSYFCIDSTGVTKDLPTPPTSVICK